MAYRCRDDGDCIVCSSCDLLICTDDIFLALFGCFCLWSCFYKLLHDLACLEEFLDDSEEEQDMFLRSSLFSRFHLILLDRVGEFDA